MVPAVANSIISRTYSTPVGTIISLYGKTAPAGYLACDGATYNRDEYPDLAEYLVGQFEDLVGDGETTFKVPDLQGEFLRGTGTNSHANQGSGVNVGEHQDGTYHAYGYGTKNGTTFASPADGTNAPFNMDAVSSYLKRRYSINGSVVTDANMPQMFTSRPTNTSILYCIKY